MKRHTVQKIYLDTNVLINYCTGQDKEREALEYLFRMRRKEVLFTSSLALVQTITNMQTKKKERKAYSKEETTKLIGNLLPKKCDAIITNNVSDFIYFRDIEVLKPEKRLLSLKVK